MSKEQKQFTLDSKESCIIYLCRIISTCEQCMDKFKRYNKETKDILDHYKGLNKIPSEIYDDICNKTYNVLSYILNILGDAQKSSISYFKYRNIVQKRSKDKGNSNFDIIVLEPSSEITDILSQFNRMRNWVNHIPESLLIAELDMIKSGKAELPMDPVTIIHYNYVTYEYFEHLYLSNINFCNKARKIIQFIKREYSLLMEKTIEYPRAYIDKPRGLEYNQPAEVSARVQGIK